MARPTQPGSRPGAATSTSTNERARLLDVARAAGVSKSYASKVLNGRYVPALPETRERLLAAAKDLGYRPHAVARALARSETGAIGLVVPDLTNPVYARIVRGACTRALERGFVALVLEDLAPAAAEQEVRELVLAGRIDGLIVGSARPDHPLVESMGEHGFPHVFVNRSVPGSGRNVVIEDEATSRLAVDHLTEHGHKHIGHVAGPAVLSTGLRRASGFRAEAERFGIADPPVAEADYSAAGGAEAATRLLREHRGITGLYVGTLVQAIGSLQAIADAGLEVPRDVSLVCADDLQMAEYLRPPLTRIRVPLAELGAAAVDALLDQLLGEAAADVTVAAPPILVPGESVGPPPATG
jgi:DNA-binding LacI/PurR family transcriptional regulator